MLYRRVITGLVEPGKHDDFLAAAREAADYQARHGVEASTKVWSAMSGKNGTVVLTSDFDSLAELEKFEHLVATDEEFGRVRRKVMASLAFGTAETQILRELP